MKEKEDVFFSTIIEFLRERYTFSKGIKVVAYGMDCEIIQLDRNIFILENLLDGSIITLTSIQGIIDADLSGLEIIDESEPNCKNKHYGKELVEALSPNTIDKRNNFKWTDPQKMNMIDQYGSLKEIPETPYNFLVHGVTFGIQKNFMLIEKNNLGTFDPKLDLDLINNPQDIKKLPTVSCSLINNKKKGTFTLSGLILTPNIKQIIASDKDDLGTSRDGSGKTHKGNYINTNPQNLLDETQEYNHNEIVLSNKNIKTTVSGFFIKVDWLGIPLDYNEEDLIDVVFGLAQDRKRDYYRATYLTSELTRQASMHHGLPLVLILGDSFELYDRQGEYLKIISEHLKSKQETLQFTFV